MVGKFIAIALAISTLFAGLALSSTAPGAERLDAGTANGAPPAAITRLTRDPANALHPAWSPDNRLIAFESNRDGPYHLFVMRADGTQLRALTSGESDDRHPSWTPDGKAIVYDSSDGVYQDIWIVEVASGKRRQITAANGLADHAVVSPDGRTIAFYVYKDMTLNLWSVSSDGSGAKALTRDLGDARRNEPTMAWHRAGWSPDGKYLAYTGGDGRSIWRMRADGTAAERLVSDGETNHFPWFLADGRLAYITEYVPPAYGGAWTNAWALDLRTGQRTLLQEFMSMQGPVDWSSDRTRVLFASPRAGNFDLYVIDLSTPYGVAALRGTPVPARAQ